jgi:hypothetical protein
MLFAGVNYKMRVTNRLYFSPAFDIYLSHYFYPNEIGIGYLRHETMCTAGLNLNFDYLLSRKFSLNFCVIENSFGLRFPGEINVHGSYFQNNHVNESYEWLGAGIRYNFN